MCQTCGCALAPTSSIVIHNHDHPHPHNHEHPEKEATPPGESIGRESRQLSLSQALLAKNDRLAERNRGYFEAKGVFVVNLLSSPGSGKTSFIERTLREQNTEYRGAVIVGDLATDNDAQRLRQTGAQAIQITTGTVCHLEADMVSQAARQIDFSNLNLLLIENVGNLVCPADYDLGEDLRVVLLSVTEGEDKPLKYPGMFKSAQVIILNKIDIAEAVGFNSSQALATLRQVAPQAQIFEVSARTGAGMEAWYQYLRGCLPEVSLSLDSV